MIKIPTGTLAKVSAENPDVDPRKFYDSWAKDYNDDLIYNYGYVAHKISTLEFCKLVSNKTIQIIDVGCGTGLVGKELKKLGYNYIDGYDISSKMLERARKTGAYQDLIELDLKEQIDSKFKTYDALISVGCFGYGSLNRSSLLNLIKLVNSDGIILIFMNAQPFTSKNYHEYITCLDKQGLWKIISISEHNYMNKLKRPGKLIIAIKK